MNYNSDIFIFIFEFFSIISEINSHQSQFAVFSMFINNLLQYSIALQNHTEFPKNSPQKMWGNK